MSKKIDEQKLLELHLDHPERSYHIREMARLCRMNPTTATKYLNRFVKAGMLTKRKERHHILYKASTEHPLYRWEKVAHNVRRILTSGVITFLEQQFNYPKAIVLFGSCARGENIERSDIDLFIIAESKKKDVQLQKFEEILGSEVQLFVHTQQEVAALITTNSDLLNSVVNGIVVSGYFEVFA